MRLLFIFQPFPGQVCSGHSWQKFKIVLVRKTGIFFTPFIQKFCQNTIFGSSRISFHFLNSIFQGSRFSFQFLNSIFQGSRISFRFLNFCQECYYFQKLVGVVVFPKVRGPFFLKLIYHCGPSVVSQCSKIFSRGIPLWHHWRSTVYLYKNSKTRSHYE